MKKVKFILLLLFFSTNLFANNFFQKLISAAYQNNYLIKSYEKYVKSTKENINIVNGNFFPKIDLSYQFIGTTEPGQAAFLKAKQGKFTMNYYYKYMADPPFVKDYQFMISLIQPIFSKGKIFLSKKQAKLNYQAALYSLKEVKRDIKFKIFNILIEANKLFDEIDIAKNLKKKAQIYLNTLENFYKNGTALKSDYLYAKYHLEETEIRLETLKNELNKLNFILNQLTGKNFKLIKTSFPIQKKLNIQKLIEYALNNREEIMAFKNYVKVAEIEVKKKKNEYLPEVFGFANYERNSEKITNFDEDGYTVGIGIKMNIFNGMIDRNKIMQAKYNLMRMKNLLFNKQEEIKREIKSSYLDFKNAKYIYVTMKNLVNSNETALKISEKRFTQGLERITTLVDIETNYKNSLNKLSQAKWDMILKYYTILYKAGKF